MRIGLLASMGHMIDSFFTDFITSWESAGHTVFVAAGTPVDDGRSVEIDGLTRRPGPGILRAGQGLRRWVHEQRLDVVVTNSATASSLVRMSRVSAPVVYFCHGLHWNSGRHPNERLWQFVEAALLSRTAGVITINADDHAWFAARLDDRRVLNLPVGVGLELAAYPPSPVPSRRALSAQELRLLWVGEFSPRKRPGLALDLALRLRDSGIPFTLRMLGEGDLLTSTRARIRELSLESQVEAPGRGDAAAELASSHSLIHTATWEGLPRVMLESLAVGRRAYAFDVKGVRDISQAVLSPDADTTALADRIAADWVSGAMLQPLGFDRETLDLSRSAECIRRFLEDVVVGPQFITARGDRTRQPAPGLTSESPNGTP